MLPAKKKPIIGLDIGSYSIKGIILDETKSGLILKSLGVANLPPQAIVEGSVQEKEIVVQAIRNLVKTLKIKAKAVSTSISGYSVIIKKISLPTATREELAENIEVEAEQFIPFDISEVNVDFQILGQQDEQDEQMEVILVAAKKDVIDSYVDLLEQAGLSPHIIDVDVFALENTFTVNYPEVTGTVALVDIGANKMNINVVKDGSSLFTKDAAMGGARITEEIQDAFDLGYEEAEAVKLGATEAPDQAALEEIVCRAVENWVAEAKRTIDLLAATYPSEELREIYLSGGSSRLSGLEKIFEQEMGVPVHILNPFQKIGIDQKKFDPEYVRYVGAQNAICTGLALRRGETI